MKLPPLPQPTLQFERPLSKGSGGVAALFSADQMRERDRQIVELCAQMCEQVGPKEGSLRLVTQSFADAIRALLEEPT